MLTVKTKKPCADISIDIDEYIPFTIEVHSAEPPVPPIYWRGGDGKHSLVEIGLNRKDGSVCSITLTAIAPQKIRESNVVLNADLPESSGLAVFDVSAWSSESQNYSDDFQDAFGDDVILLLGRNYLTLQFENVDEPIRYIRNGRLGFGVTSNGVLSTLNISELTEIEVNRLRPVS